MFKCSLTREKCGAIAAGFYDNGDSCPLGKYKNSSRYYGSRESKDGGLYLDDTCRYYGIARAKKLENEKFRN